MGKDHAPSEGFEAARSRLARNADRVIETACAVVFLTEGEALKIKKPVDLGYLDFTSLESRRWAIGRELAFNRRAAPDVYRTVREVCGEPVLVMRRFDPADVLACDPARLSEDLAEVLGRQICRAQAEAPTSQACAYESLAYVAQSNAQLLKSLEPGLNAPALVPLLEATNAALDASVDHLKARGGLTMVRRCHGDLHLGNIVVEAGRPILFDCIEFNDRLSEIDVLYDIAFLVMDLCARSREPVASRVLNAWVDEGLRLFGDAAVSGLRLLPLYVSVRAAVRAHVSGNGGDAGSAAAYVERAFDALRPLPPSLTAIGGRSGAGKTTLARRMAPGMGAAGGALILRSDEIRKRIHGAAAADRLSPDAYGAEASIRVYDELFRLAALGLQSGRPVILDAAFLRPGERDRARRTADVLGVPFEGLWLSAPIQERLARVEARAGDASDADAEVVRLQETVDVGPLDWVCEHA